MVKHYEMEVSINYLGKYPSGKPVGSKYFLVYGTRDNPVWTPDARRVKAWLVPSDPAARTLFNKMVDGLVGKLNQRELREEDLPEQISQ